MNRLRRIVFLLALVVTVVLIATPSLALPQALHPPRSISADLSSQLYLPIVTLPRDPIGFVTTPAELLATKALADQAVEPSRKALRELMDDAEDGLLFVPCAFANYTTETASGCLNESAQFAYVLALAYRMTNDLRYANQSAAILRAWYTTLATIDPQPPNDTNQPWLDWSRWGPAMTWGADLLEGSPAWFDADRRQFSAMLTDKVLAVGRKASARTNNWADSGNLLRLTIAIYADLPDERAAAIASWKQLLDAGMAADGSLPEENRRGVSGLSYNQTALSAKTVFAEIMRRRGDSSLYDYQTPRGVGLRNGWDFLAPQVVNANAGLCVWPYTIDHCVSYTNKGAWEIAYARWHTPAYLVTILLKRPYDWSDASNPGYGTLLFANLDISD